MLAPACGLAQASAVYPASPVDGIKPAHLVMPLPDAPPPMPDVAIASSPDRTALDAEAARRRAILLSSSQWKYSIVLKPGQSRVPLTVREKFIYSMIESVSPEEAVVVTIGSGINQAINGNPKYGTNIQGFGEREGASALREASTHLLGDGVFASAFHQDPRYFRMGPGFGVMQRMKHVIVATVTSHSDRDGRMQLDYSGLLGRGSTSAMTLLYYPHVSATGVIATETFGYSVLGDLGGNGFLEFWPDVVQHFRGNGGATGAR